MAIRTKTRVGRIQAIVNLYGYQIVDCQTNEVLYWAGNNPHDSSPTQSLANGKGNVDMATLEKWARETAQSMIADPDEACFGARFFGVKHDNFV